MAWGEGDLDLCQCRALCQQEPWHALLFASQLVSKAAASVGSLTRCSSTGWEREAGSCSGEGGAGARRPLRCWHQNAARLGGERLPQRLLPREPRHQPQFQLPRVLPLLLGQQRCRRRGWLRPDPPGRGGLGGQHPWVPGKAWARGRGPPLPASAVTRLSRRFTSVLSSFQRRRHRNPQSCLAQHPDPRGCQHRSPCGEVSPGRDKPVGSRSSPLWVQCFGGGQC